MHRYAFHGMLTGGAAAIALISASVMVPAQTAPSQHDAGCTQLSSLKITASEIGLPTSGATIASAQIATVPTDPADPAAGTREYCKVLGAIAPVDRNAPPINFQVNLPVQWNGKAVQYGGGGSNGVLITGLNALRDARRETPVPVARGFATWGTDAGHQNEALSEPFAFALNEEALVNMAYASYKKTRDVARRVAEAFYGRVPSRTYFFGGSSGGREGLMMAQRFPDDFDGIVSVVPVVHYTGLTLVKARLAPLQRAGGWMNTAKVKLVHRAVNAACDSLDNLADGIIGAYEQCRFGVASLRCEKGTDAGDDCLSDAQIEADTLLRRPFKYPFPMAHGVTAFPGWSYGSEDQPGGMAAMVSGSEPPTFPIKNARAQSVFWIFGDPTIRYLFARDATFNPLRLFRRHLLDAFERYPICMTQPIPTCPHSTRAAES
jgi:feruloyl esterase